MLDSQKMSFEKWLTSYKHGVYIFTSDTCSFCEDYKKSIEYVNNCYLYFVEVNKENEKKILAKHVKRTALPITARYKDNVCEKVQAGQLFETQLKEVFEYLKPFGNVPLSNDEIKKRLDEQHNTCFPTFYVFPPDCPQETKNKIMNSCFDHRELPIDVDLIAPDLPLRTREFILKGQYYNTKLVIYRDAKTNIFSPLAQSVILNYSQMKDNTELEIRMIDDELGAN